MEALCARYQRAAEGRRMKSTTASTSPEDAWPGVPSNLLHFSLGASFRFAV